MAIEVYDSKQVISTVSAPMKDANALSAPGRALQGLGSGIQRAGDLMADFALQKQNAVNVANIHSAELKMEEAYANFQTEMAKEGDEEKWRDMWNETWNETSSAIFSDDLAPVVKERLNVMMEQFKGRTDIQVQGMATKRAIQRAKAKTEMAVEKDLENGDLASAERKINEGLAANLYDPEEAQKRKERAQSRIDYYEASRLIQDDPEDTYKLLSERTAGGKQYKHFKNLQPDTRNSLMAHARREGGRLKAENYGALIRRTANDKPVPIWEIEEMVELGEITSGQAGAYIREFHSAKLHPFDTSRMAQILRNIEAYDPSQDPFFEQFADIHGDILPMPSRQATLLMNRLNQKQEGGLGSSKTADMVTRRLDRMFSSHFFSGGIAPDTPDSIREANVSYLETVESAQSIMQENPKMSASDVMEKLFEQPALSDSVLKHSQRYRSQMGSIDLEDREKSMTRKRAALEAYQAVFPQLTPDMTVEEALAALPAEASDQDKADVKRVYAILEGEEDLFPEPDQKTADPFPFDLTKGAAP